MYEDDDLTVKTIVEILEDLLSKMFEQRAGGRWAELSGLIKFDGVNIGRIKVEKAQPGTTVEIIDVDGRFGKQQYACRLLCDFSNKTAIS